MPPEPEKIIAEMNSLMAESRRLHQRHSEIVLQYQKLYEELQRLKQGQKAKLTHAVWIPERTVPK